ncbi:hypothetical protein J3Q64DRAFT_1099777 [Phycomyces blakesleeanus]|uniref:Cas1p 10 TM acyl transferase domain-containing protein n=1 Tax=Phycomyces blakesleeanus TaxID=4837 RepID=A0ABR3AZU6_PHYBL
MFSKTTEITDTGFTHTDYYIVLYCIVFYSFSFVGAGKKKLHFCVLYIYVFMYLGILQKNWWGNRHDNKDLIRSMLTTAQLLVSVSFFLYITLSLSL